MIILDMNYLITLNRCTLLHFLEEFVKEALDKCLLCRIQVKVMKAQLCPKRCLGFPLSFFLSFFVGDAFDA